VSKLNEAGDDGHQVARKLVAARPRPTAIVTATDHEARDVYRAAADAGLAIPGDLTVIGFADLDFAAGMSPPLTTVRQRASEIGSRAAAMLLGRIESAVRDSEYRDVRVTADLIVRGSTGPAPSA
jgi:LacI family transcriptional regulator